MGYVLNNYITSRVQQKICFGVRIRRMTLKVRRKSRRRASIIPPETTKLTALTRIAFEASSEGKLRKTTTGSECYLTA